MLTVLLQSVWGGGASAWAQTPGDVPLRTFSVEFESGAGYIPNLQTVALPGSTITLQYDAGTYTLSWPDHRNHFRSFWLENTGPQHVNGVYYRLTDNHAGTVALWGGLDPGERVEVSYLFDWIRFFPANPCVECFEQIAGQQIPITWTLTAFVCNSLNPDGTCGDQSFPSASVDQQFVVAAQDVTQRPLNSVVMGRVYDAGTGQDLATGIVEVMNPSAEMRRPPFNLQPARTDGSSGGIGRYRISVPAMTALIRCDAPGYQTQYQTATVDSGATVTADCAMTTMPWSANYSLVNRIDTGTGLWGWAQTPDGQKVLVTSALTATPPATLATSSYAWLVNLSDGSVAWKHFLGAGSMAPAVSPDGMRFAIPILENFSGPTSALHVVDAGTGVLQFQWVPSPYDELVAAAYSPDGKYLAVGGAFGKIYLLETTGYTTVWSKQLEAQVRAISFSPDSQTIYATSDPSPIYALGLDGSVKWRSHTKGFAYADDIVQSADGSRVAIKSKLGEYLVLDQNGHDIVREEARDGGGTVVRIALDGSYAMQVTGTYNGAHLVDPAGKLYWWANEISEASELMSDPGIVLVGPSMYDLGGTLLWTDMAAVQSFPHVTVITPDARHILAAGEDGVIYVYSGGICTNNCGALPQTHTLSVSSSNPSSGASITVAPSDKNNQSNGSTQFMRTYDDGTSVTLTAPAVVGDDNFINWTGCDSTSGSPATTCTVNVSADKTVTAVYGPPLTLAALTLPGAEVQVSYAAPLVNGGVPPYSFSPVKGVFPPGLSFDTTDGRLSGTPGPSKGGTFSIHIMDGASGSITGTFKLTIASTLDITTQSLKTGTQGKAYKAALKVKGGKKPLTWSELTGNLAAAGLTLNASTGAISGVPSASSGVPINLTFEVTDQLGGSAQTDLTLTIQ
jgi:putative Ig domain-containing protein